MQQFDDIFADRVRDAFDRYAESVDPVAWSNMQERLGHVRRRRLLLMLPLLGRAAAILLLVVVSVVAYDTLLPRTQEMLTIVNPFAIPSEAYPFPEPSRNISATQNVQTSPESLIASSKASVPAGDDVSTIKSQDIVSQPEARQAVLPSMISNSLLTDDPVAIQSGSHILTVDRMIGDNSTQMANIETGLDLLDFAPASTKRKGIPGLGLAAGSMLTYAGEQLSRGMGFTGGLVSEWRLWSRMGISSGLMIAYQNFEVERMPLMAGAQMEESAGEAWLVNAFGNHEYEFLTIDIPLNMQFVLHESRRSEVIFSAGVSSLLYVQQQVRGENYAHTIEFLSDPSTGEHQPLSSMQAQKVNTSYAPFRHLDLAGMLNVSFGYVLKGNQGATVVEPFIKYPLGDLSSRNLRMGMGGVSLRYRFGGGNQ